MKASGICGSDIRAIHRAHRGVRDGAYRAVALTSAHGTDTVTDPAHVVPTTVPVAGLGAAFDYTFPAHSVTVLQVEAK